MTDIPEVVCEVAWDTPPLERPDPGDWTRIDNVTDGPQLRTLTTSRGAKVKVAEVEAGTASSTWGNKGRMLEPDGPGPWNVRTRRRIRWSVPDGDGFDIFTGFIDKITPTWAGGDVAVDLSAADLLGLIAEEELPASALGASTLLSDPVGYWPLVESEGLVAGAAVGLVVGDYRVPASASHDIMAFDDRAVAELRAASDDDRLGQEVVIDGVRPDALGGTLAWSWRHIDGDVSALTVGVCNALSWRDRSSPRAFSVNHEVTIGVGDDGEVLLTIADGSTIETAPSLQTPLLDGATHRITMRVDPTTERVHVWVDGHLMTWLTDVTTGKDWSSIIDELQMVRLGYAINFPVVMPTLVAAAGHLVAWDRLLTSAEVVVDYEAAASAWDGDTTSERLDRVLDLIGIDADDRDINPTVTVCGPTKLGGNALDYLRRLAATEGGTIVVDPAGRISLRPRIENNPTPVATFDGGLDGGTPYRDVVPVFDPYRSINTADVTAEGCEPTRSESPESIAELGRLSVAIETLHRVPGQGRVAGDELVHRFDVPRMVIERLELASPRDDVPLAEALGLDVASVVEVSARLGGVDVAPLVQTSVIERVEQVFDWQAWTWTTSYTLAEHLTLPAFMWDEDGQGWDEAAWSNATPTPAGWGVFTGGTTWDLGGWRYHEFTASGTLVVVEPGLAECLVVDSGASSGYYSGGGGGRVQERTGIDAIPIAVDTSITVGLGAADSDGQPSSIGALVVGGTAGRGGQISVEDGHDGTSGGGGAAGSATGSGLQTFGGTGSTGGNGGRGTRGTAGNRAGGGGGGALGDGSDAVGGIGGNGGAGVTSAIDGKTYGTGGNGGDPGYPAIDAADNTGDGGSSGLTSADAAGGSGYVLIRTRL